MNLPDLPTSDSKFWDGEVEVRDMKRNTSHRHFFVREGPSEIRCECGFGLFIKEDDDIKDGHLYHSGVLVL